MPPSSSRAGRLAAAGTLDDLRGSGEGLTLELDGDPATAEAALTAIHATGAEIRVHRQELPGDRTRRPFTTVRDAVAATGAGIRRLGRRTRPSGSAPSACTWPSTPVGPVCPPTSPSRYRHPHPRLRSWWHRHRQPSRHRPHPRHHHHHPPPPRSPPLRHRPHPARCRRRATCPTSSTAPTPASSTAATAMTTASAAGSGAPSARWCCTASSGDWGCAAPSGPRCHRCSRRSSPTCRPSSSWASSPWCRPATWSTSAAQLRRVLRLRHQRHPAVRGLRRPRDAVHRPAQRHARHRPGLAPQP